MRTPSGGNDVSGALVRTMIQCWLSQGFCGNVNGPLNTAPACSMIVSPQAALLSACCSAELLLTFQLCPLAGVFANSVCRNTRGSCAGPSMAPTGVPDILSVKDWVARCAG